MGAFMQALDEALLVSAGLAGTHTQASGRLGGFWGSKCSQGFLFSVLTPELPAPSTLTWGLEASQHPQAFSWASRPGSHHYCWATGDLLEVAKLLLIPGSSWDHCGLAGA